MIQNFKHMGSYLWCLQRVSFFPLQLGLLLNMQAINTRITFPIYKHIRDAFQLDTHPEMAKRITAEEKSGAFRRLGYSAAINLKMSRRVVIKVS